MKIFLDFDGTVVEHEYPRIGRCNFGCMEVIKKLQDSGHEIILNTYRVDCNDGTLEEALDFLQNDSWMMFLEKEDEQELSPITEFCKKKIHPRSWDWNDIKNNGEMFIDDIAFNIPLKRACMTEGEMVDWKELDKQFEKNGVYTNTKKLC